MIRDFLLSDILRAREIHEDNKLDSACMPSLTFTTPAGKDEWNKLFITKSVFEHEGRPAIMAFLKVTAEVFVLVDHTVGTPEERWTWMQEFNQHIRQEAWKHGLEQITCWVPGDVEESFAKRLTAMGYIKSPWQSWTLNLE
jgi:hypothetical protein